MQPLPASPDTFIWLRLYQQEVPGLVPAGSDDPLWWTLGARSGRSATDAAREMFNRASGTAPTSGRSAPCGTPRATRWPATRT